MLVALRRGAQDVVGAGVQFVAHVLELGGGAIGKVPCGVSPSRAAVCCIF